MEQRRILEGVEKLLLEPETGDIKQLKGKPVRYRLRVGDWRVIFTRERSPETRTITVREVFNRREGY